jgi:3-hydroxybutyryl-CoA dehydrogenase
MIERVTIVGAGLMGHGIAQLFAVAGIPVRLSDVAAGRLDEALHGIGTNLELLVEEGVLERDEAKRALARVEAAAGLEEAVDGAGFVLEAITESLEAKRELFARIEAIVGPEIILATNTSTLPLSRIAAHARVPERIVVTHFFNPPHLVPLVEVLPHPAARADLVDATLSLMRRIGSRPVLLRKEVPGLVANRLQAALAREALYLLEEGVADAADIDAAVTEGPGLRWPFLGPLAVADYGGLDVWKKVVENLAPELGRSTTAPPALAERVRRGELGTKTAQGIFAYRREEVPELVRARDRNLVRLGRLKRG